MQTTKKDRVGEIHYTNENCKIIITEYFNTRNITVQFEDGHIVKNRQYSDALKGRIKNVHRPSVLDKGYLGEGPHKAYINGERTVAYETWHHMLQRCYDKKYHVKHPTYKNCYVCDAWLNYQTFCDWFYKNYVDGYVLDKDLIKKNNKCYCPEYSTFIPAKMNSLLTKANAGRGEYAIGVSYKKTTKNYFARLNKYGENHYLGVFSTEMEAFNCYKANKEAYLKEMARKYKDKVDPRVYAALMVYEVEFDD